MVTPLFLQGKGFSVILSDMCPVVTGITTRDAALSCELGKRALSLAIGRGKKPGSGHKNDGKDFFDSSELDANEDGVLRRGGNLVVKLLESEGNQGEKPHQEARKSHSTSAVKSDQCLQNFNFLELFQNLAISASHVFRR